MKVVRSSVFLLAVIKCNILVIGTGYADCTYCCNKGATAFSNVHPIVVLINEIDSILLQFRMTDLYIITYTKN